MSHFYRHIFQVNVSITIYWLLIFEICPTFILFRKMNAKQSFTATILKAKQKIQYFSLYPRHLLLRRKMKILLQYQLARTKQFTVSQSNFNCIRVFVSAHPVVIRHLQRPTIRCNLKQIYTSNCIVLPENSLKIS